MFLVSLLCFGCENDKNKASYLKVLDYIENLNSYSVDSVMTTRRGDRDVSIDVGVDYLAPNYYKVCFNSNGNKQFIIKNDSGVYVISPDVNKQFKFDSDWPLNSSHAYLLDSILKDIKADGEVSYGVLDDNIYIDCKINHKTNKNVVKMRYLCNSSDYRPYSCSFLNENNECVIDVVFKDFKETDFKKEHFNHEQYMTEQENNNSMDTSVIVSSEFSIEGNVLMASSNKDNVTILCYSGQLPYTIVIQEALSYSDVIVFDEYNDVEVLECGLCFINDNYMRYYLGNYEVTIYSNVLNVDQYLSIASSISLA